MELIKAAHNYQIRAARFAIEKKCSYSAMDMGLGKTLTALLWAKGFPDLPGAFHYSKSVLVIASIRGIYSTWPEEIRKWTPEYDSIKLHGPNKTEALRLDVPFYLINYEGLQWLLLELKKIFKQTKKLPFRAIIMDECSKAKAHNTKRFKVLNVLSDIAPEWKYIMSGTPSPNSLLDLWAQYHFLDNGERLGHTITSYRDAHFNQFEIKERKRKDGRVTKVKKKIFGYRVKEGHEDIIHRKIGDITFRLDAEDYIEIPPRVINEIRIDMPKSLQEQYYDLEDNFFVELEEADVEAMSAASLAMKLRQFTQGALYTDGPKVNGERPYVEVHKEKLKVLQELVEDANGKGILCAIQFRFELDIIRKAFPGTPCIAGGTSATEVARLITEWNKGNIPLLICHPGSISDSVNLQAGSHLIVWYALTWSLYQYLQFNARLHRQGQIKTVVIHHLLLRGTLDERLMKALNNKFKGQRALLDYLKGLR